MSYFAWVWIGFDMGNDLFQYLARRGFKAHARDEVRLSLLVYLFFRGVFVYITQFNGVQLLRVSQYGAVVKHPN